MSAGLSAFGLRRSPDFIKKGGQFFIEENKELTPVTARGDSGSSAGVPTNTLRSRRKTSTLNRFRFLPELIDRIHCRGRLRNLSS